MNLFKTYSWRLLAFCALAVAFSCNKEERTVFSPTLDLADNALVREWFDLSLTLSQHCNGYAEPITARSFSYLSFALYESLVPGIPGLQPLQVRLDGFKLTLPQPDPALQYNWAIVANEAVAQLNRKFYESAGEYWMQKLEETKSRYLTRYSKGLEAEVIENSQRLGRAIARSVWEYSLLDGNAYSFLNNYPKDYSIPKGLGYWVPTSPDYRPIPLLPNWGNARPVMQKNISETVPVNILKYSPSPNSTIFAEALEVYTLSTQVSPDQKETLNYFNKEMHLDAAPLAHVFRLAIQVSRDQQLDLASTVKLFCTLSFAIHDGYVASWKQKFTNNLMRVSTYIKENIDRFYVPLLGSSPSPDFVSEEAVTYSIGSEILSSYFGYRFPFMDHTQRERSDLRSNTREFDSFRDFAREAAFIDLNLGVHYRTSIESGMDLGYQISQNMLRIEFDKN